MGFLARELETACGRLQRQGVSWATLSWELASASGAQGLSVTRVCGPGDLQSLGWHQQCSTVLQCHSVPTLPEDSCRSWGQEPMI